MRCGCGKGDAGKDGQCRACRLRALGLAKRKYAIAPEMIEELRAAYCGSRRELSATLRRLERRTGWAQSAFVAEARRRGWQRPRKPWTDREREIVADLAGQTTAARIARRLKRSQVAVCNEIRRLGLSRRLREGYTLQDLEKVFGVSDRRVLRWYKQGLLGKPAIRTGNEVRFGDTAVLMFICANAHEFDLRRVDQIWFKAMVFARG